MGSVPSCGRGAPAPEGAAERSGTRATAAVIGDTHRSTSSHPCCGRKSASPEWRFLKESTGTMRNVPAQTSGDTILISYRNEVMSPLLRLARVLKEAAFGT